MAAHTLVIKVTAGKDEPERCGQALTVAATAIASGVAVSLWLAAEAAWLALPGPRRRHRAAALPAAWRTCWPASWPAGG